MIRRPPRSTLSSSSAASDVYKRQGVSLTAILPALGPRDDAVVQCWDVAGCSETTRQECLPRLWDRRCFELDTCHCRGDGTSCMTCPVFAAAGGLHLGPAAEAPRV